MKRRSMARRTMRRTTPEELLPPEEAYGVAEPTAMLDPDLEIGGEDINDRPVRALMQRQVSWRRLALVALIVAAAGMTALGVWEQIPADLVSQWPWLLVIVGGVGLLIGLIAAWSYGTVGGPLVAAIGVVALLDQQAIPSVLMAVAGAMLIVLGFAVVLRGLTMPRT